MGSLMFSSNGPGPSPAQALLSGLRLQATGGVDAHTDVILHAREGTKIKVHKAVLWAMSPYLKNVLQALVPRACVGCPGAISSEPEIFLPDVGQQMLSKVIQFIYTGTVVGTESEKDELKDILANVFGIGPTLAMEESTPAPGQQRLDCPLADCPAPEDILPCNAWAHFQHHLAAEMSGHRDEVDANMSIKCIVCRAVINYIDQTPELSRQKFEQHYKDHTDDLKIFVFEQSGGYKVDSTVDELLRRQAQEMEELANGQKLDLMIADIHSRADEISSEAAEVAAAAVVLPEEDSEDPALASDSSYSGGVVSSSGGADEDEPEDVVMASSSSTAPPPAKRSKKESAVVKRKCARCPASVAQQQMQSHLITHYYDKFTKDLEQAYRAGCNDYRCPHCDRSILTKTAFLSHLASAHDLLKAKLGGLEVEDLFDPIEEPPLLSKADFITAEPEEDMEQDKGSKENE